MSKYKIGVDDFKREFGHYVEHNGLTIIERELDPNHVNELIVIPKLDPSAFKYDILRDELKYWTWPFFVWRKGEHVRGIKGVGEEYVWPVLKIEQMKAKQRHVRAWHLKDPNLMATTIHDEPSPSTMYRNPVQAIRYHLFSEGKADYISGTTGFWEELENVGI